jgi:hypothetical protein
VVRDSNELIFRGVLDPMPTADYEILIPSLPEGAARLDFFADFNDNGEYDPPPTDHAWRLDIAATGDDSLTFIHNTNFDDIDDPTIVALGGDFVLNGTGLAPHIGQMFEIRVTQPETERVVGRYVAGEVSAAIQTWIISGIIGAGVDYQIDFFADFNDNGEYD